MATPKLSFLDSTEGQTTEQPSEIYIESPDKKENPQEKTIGGFLSNIPSSGAGLVEPFMHPVQTGTASVKVIMGLIEKMTPGEPSSKYSKDVPYFDALIDGLKDRYGSLQSIKDTMYSDPVGFIADASSIVSMGGTAGAKMAGMAARVAPAGGKAAITLSRVERVAKLASGYAEIADPLRATGSLMLKMKGPASTFVASILGTTTGKGAGSVRKAYEGTSAFVDQMRGKGSINGVVDDMRTALGNLKNERSSAYRTKLAQLKQSTATIDLSPVYSELSSKLDDFGVKLVPSGTPGGTPTLDFSRSTIHALTDQAKVNSLFSDIMSWGTKPDDLTPIGVDTLKRRIGDFYADSSQARALVSDIYGRIKTELDRIPGYSEMTKEYEIASEMIKNFESELSLKGSNPGPTIRKIINTFNQNNDYRSSLIDALNKYSGGKKLTDQIAGVGMNSNVPSGIMRPLLGASILGGIGGVTTGAVNPSALLALAATSPRLVGEASSLAGKTSRGMKAVINKSKLKATTKAKIYRPAEYARQAGEANEPQP